jgi:hypothetical protein
MGAHVQCPRCEQAYALSDEQTLLYAGREFECAQCTLKFIIPANSAKPQAPTQGPPATLRGELPRDPLTAAAVRAPAGMALPYPTFGMGLSQYALNDADAGVLSSRLAAASMIFGIIGLLVPIVPGALAILLGIIAAVRISRGKAQGASLAAGGIAVGAAGMLLSSALLYPRIIPAYERWRYASSSQGTCIDHFRTIEKALDDYAAAHDGKFPDSLADVVADGKLDADALICAASSDVKAAGITPVEIAKKIRTGRHCSYVYAGKGLSKQSPGECVLLYESLGAHRADGIRVLFVDGRVQTIGAIESAKGIERLNRDINPPWTVTR